jgi:predicted component of viral defense system (DUF524 family)
MSDYNCDHVNLNLGETFLTIEVENNIDKNSLLNLPAEVAKQNSEEKIQLLEGCTYGYEFLDKNYSLKPIPGIIKPSTIKKYRGRITPGIYVGRLAFDIVTSDNKIIETAVEVRSVKTDYRNEYRKMLEDITAECTELLMNHTSPVTQKYMVDFDVDSETLYQRFAFVKAIVDSENFRNAVLRVISMPVTLWKKRNEEIDVRRIRKISPNQMRQIATKSNRIPLPIGFSLRKNGKLKSVPSKLISTIKIDTVDTPENRFIKHALKEFERFCGVVCSIIEKNQKDKSKRPHIYSEAKELEIRFSEYLNYNIFREISKPVTLSLNSPILQRKEGYREILKVWLMYDLAAKLSWHVLDEDTYLAGKRDVATLYEYWLFFKLLRLFESIFKIDAKETKSLIKETDDGLGLTLKSGKYIMIEGEYTHNNRNLKIQFSYNKIFNYSNYPSGGSWSQKMRPDYTLSIWPSDFTKKEAEIQELIIHIHFDAKYKVDGLKYLIDNEDINLDEDKNLQKEGTYKRADLLKMHAYKDAIRRTAGAYVLYPGTEKSHPFKGFHEIIPGLGAFPISPSNDGDDLNAIRDFIYEIINHFTNRASQRESYSYQTHKIMKDIPHNIVKEQFPEFYTSDLGDKERSNPPSDIYVLVGYVQNKQKKWIKENGYYNIRFDDEISPEMTGAKYLLLYKSYNDKNQLELWENGLFEIEAFPKIKTAEWLREKNYKNPKNDEYFIYRIKTDISNWSQNKIIDIKRYKKKYKPFTMNLLDLLRKKQ